jgi:hypothetical protein
VTYLSWRDRYSSSSGKSEQEKGRVIQKEKKKDTRSPSATDDLKQNLLNALTDEIEHIKKEGGSNSYTIRNGERIGRVSGRSVFRFDFDGERLETDVPVRVLVGESKEKIEAEIVSVVGQEITLATQAALPENIPKAKMFADPLFILERLRDQIASPPEGFNATLTRKLFGEQGPHLGIISFATDEKLNEFQSSAVSKSAGSEVFFIWGPPGTGKTTTISTIVTQAYLNRETVLVTSNTNVAVDNAISGAADSIRTSVGYSKGDIVRVGVPQAYVPDDVLPEGISRKRLREIDEEIEELERLNGKASKRVDSLRASLRTIDECHKIRDQEKTARNYVNQVRNDVALSNDKTQRLREKLAKARTTSSIMRAIRGLNLEQITLELNSGVNATGRLKNQLASVEESHRGLEVQLAILAKKSTEIARSKEDLTRECNEALSGLRANTAQISELRNKKGDIDREIVANAKVIGTTLAKTWLRKEIFDRRFDLVVVDEASMATLPMLYFASGISARRVLIVGDFKQIPPIVLANTPNTTNWLKRTIFDLVGITTLNSSSELCEMLRIQYRMNPDISRIVSTHVYDGLLQDHESVSLNLNVERPPASNYVLALVDTSNLSPWCMTRGDSHSRINLVHAELAIYMAKVAVEGGFEKIGIITPYREQARILACRIEDEKLRGKVEVATVHRFQGREKQLVIFDVSDSNPFPPSRLISTTRDELKESELLLNVAISRAQHKLIIIANSEYLHGRLHENELLRKILSDFDEHGIRLLGEQFLTFPSLEASESPIEDGIPTFKAPDFYSEFESDIVSAKENISIVSAFITARRVRMLEENLRAAAERGVTIRVLTKPANDQFDGNGLRSSSAECIKILKNLGARVEFNPETHEKIAVIDNSIVWHGSLNIFSQRESSESMMRFVGEKTARQLLTNAGLRPENILKPQSFSKLKDGMRSVTVTGTIVRIGQTQFRRKANGPTYRFAHAVLSSEGYECHLTLWDHETDLVKQGSNVRIINGYTKEYNGIVTLQSGKYGKIEVLDNSEDHDTTESEVPDEPTNKSFVPKGTCRHCGRTIQFGSVKEHETKCSAARA